MALLSRFLPFNDYDFYICGPPQFTQALYDGLRDYNIGDRRIYAEAFGPSSLKRTADAGAALPVRPPPSAKPVPVAFMDSLKEARWTPNPAPCSNWRKRAAWSPSSVAAKATAEPAAPSCPKVP